MASECLYRAEISGRFVAGVVTNESGTITVAAPILKTFVGQHISRLEEWLRRKAGTVKRVVQE